ncbi:MAG: hypothetical protein V1850_01005 [Candidatus Bathyarchaeota archaeon]
MVVYSVVTCVVKPQKQEEFMKSVQKYIKYGEENPEKFKETKSFRVFNQIFSVDTYILIWEYLSSEDFKEFYKRLSEDEEGNKIWQEIMLLTDYSNFNLWNAINITPIWEMNR